MSIGRMHVLSSIQVLLVNPLLPLHPLPHMIDWLFSLLFCFHSLFFLISFACKLQAQKWWAACHALSNKQLNKIDEWMNEWMNGWMNEWVIWGYMKSIWGSKFIIVYLSPCSHLCSQLCSHMFPICSSSSQCVPSSTSILSHIVWPQFFRPHLYRWTKMKELYFSIKTSIWGSLP